MRTWVAIIATAIATGLAVHLAEVNAAETVVSATRFQLVDQAGTPRGYFGFLSNSTQPQISICDGGGTCRVSIGLDDADSRPYVSLFDSNNARRATIYEGGVVLFDDSAGSTSETVNLGPRGLVLAYPDGVGTFAEREAAALLMDKSGVGGADYAVLTIGAHHPGWAGVFNAPDTGIFAGATRPTTDSPIPAAAIGLESAGVRRAMFSNIFKKTTLAVFSANGKARLLR